MSEETKAETPKLTDEQRDAMLRDIHEWLWNDRQARAVRFNVKYEALCREEGCEIIAVMATKKDTGEAVPATVTKVN